MSFSLRHTNPSGHDSHSRPSLDRRVCFAVLVLAVALASAGPLLAQTTAIARGSAWRWQADGTDLGTEWREPFYDDFLWDYGNAPLGYGQPGIVTTIPYGPDANNKWPTTYFRRSFTISVNPAAVQGLTMNVNYDDGFVAYINGIEVARRELPGGTITYTTQASSHESGSFEAIDLSGQTSVLSQGSNFLAIELHQTTAFSTDLYWDADLVYSTNPVVSRGPYLQIGTPTSVQMRWRTTFPTNSRVRYGTSIGNLNQIVDDAAQTTEHIIQLSSLTPNTQYYYSVGTTTQTIEGDNAA